MRRKLIKLANRTMVVSLPQKWVQENNLVKGVEIELDVKPSSILLTLPSESAETLLSCNLSIKGFSEKVLRWVISSLHKRGFDVITLFDIELKDLKIIDDLVKNLMLGFMITNQTNKSIELRRVASESIDEFHTILRRSFLVTLNLATSVLESLKSNDFSNSEYLIGLEKTNNQLTNLCERMLHKSKGDSFDRSHFWYVLAWNSEKIADNFKYIIKLVKCEQNLKLSNELFDLYSAIIDYMRGYYECLYKFSFDKLTSLSFDRDVLETKIFDLQKKSKNIETIILSYLHIIVLQCVDFSASMVGVRYESTNVDFS